MEAVDLPYLAEYSKSGRAKCKRCKQIINKDVLRLAVMVQSPFFDGRQPNWHHFDCFFNRYHPKNVGEIKSFEILKFDDQKMIEKMLTKEATVEIKGNRKRKVDVNVSQDFFVEYSKSSQSRCIGCQEKIEKNEMRIGKMDHDSEDARRIGPFKRWFHVDCFRNDYDELGFMLPVESLNGFDKMKAADQKKLQKKIPTPSNAVKKQSKIEDNEKQSKVENNGVEKKSQNNVENKLKKQSNLIYHNLEMVKNLTKTQINSFFEANEVEEHNIPENFTRRKEFLADALVFGWPEKCDKCGGCFIFKVCRYVCRGHYDEWTHCTNEIENPSRSAVKFPDDKIRDRFEYKFVKRKRLIDEKFKSEFQQNFFENQMKQSQVKNESSDNEEQEKGILAGFTITYLGKEKLKFVKEKIEKLGGKYRKDINQTILCVISSENHWNSSRRTKNIKTIEELNIPVVTDDFLTNLSNPANSLQKAMIDSKITLWNLDENEINQRLDKLNSLNNIKSAFKSGSGMVIYEYLSLSF